MLKDNVSDEWYQDAFDENYIMMFEPLRTQEFTDKEVDCFLAQLNILPGARILDLGCGYGRHTIALKKRGFDVVGQDYSSILLEKAKKESAGLNVEWIQSDMREIPFENEFDVIINNAFGYLEDDEEELKVLKSVFKSLKPGGIFLQWEIPNKANWSRKYKHTESSNMGAYVAKRSSEYDFLTGKEYQQYSLSVNERTLLERNFCVRIFDLTEILKMYKSVGLKYIKHCDLNGNNVDFDTQELLLLSQKPNS